MSIWSSNLKFVQKTLRLPIGLESPLQNTSLMRSVPTPQMLMLRLRLLLANPVFLRSFFLRQSSWSWQTGRRKGILWTSGRNIRTIPLPWMADQMQGNPDFRSYAIQTGWNYPRYVDHELNCKIWAKDNRGRISQICSEGDLKKLSPR